MAESNDRSASNIFSAAATGDLETVTDLVNTKKVSVNNKSPDGGTALMKASANGHFNVVKFLVEKGANVNQMDKWGYDALLWAVDRHIASLNVVKYLVERKANVNAKDKQKGYTPVHWAAEHGDLEIVRYLVEKGARLDEKTNKGETPLYLAAANNRLNVLQYFIDERGAKFTVFDAAEKGLVPAVKYFIERRNKVVNAVDQDGWTVLHRAAYGGNVDLVKYLVGDKGANVEANNARKAPPITPLHAAAMRGDVDVVTYLIGRGASVDAKGSDGRTILFWAAYNGHLNLVKYFIDTLQRDVNDRDSAGKTLLHAVCSKGNEEVARFLVEEKHLNTNAQDNGGRTPLMDCLQQSVKLDVFQYLLEQTVDPVNVKLVDKNGSNVIHYAASKNYVDATTELVEKGGDYLQRNQQGQTPLDSASVAGHLETVKYLINNLGVSYDERISDAAEKGHLGLLRYLVEVKGKSVSATDEQGWTVLHRAAHAGHMEVVKYLVEKARVDVNAKNSRNEIPFTPLHAACQAGHAHIAKYLTQKGANVATKDRDGRTPLYWAADNGFLDIVKYFVNEKKAEVRQKDSFGSPMLHAAGISGHLNVLEFLIEGKGVDVNERDNDGLTLLFRTMNNPALSSIFHYLLEERKADFRIADNKGRTCLHEAAKLGFIDTVKMLVEKGADFNAKDKLGQTPVYSAAVGTDEEGGKLEVLKYFLDEKKADIHQRINDGSTLLHAAAMSGPLDSVEYLVEEKRMDVNAQDNDGYTVMYDSIQEGMVTNVNIFGYLLEKKADFRIPNKSNETCLHEAAKRGYLNVVKALIDKGADMNARDDEGSTPVMSSVTGISDSKIGGHLHVLRYFVDEKKADVHQKKNDGGTLLHVAAQNGPVEVVKYLVEEKGLDVNARDNDGYTVLFDSIIEGQISVSRYLLNEKMADFRIPSRWDETCLHEAALKGNIEMVKALVEKGADINAKNDDGNTPLYMATFGKGGSQLEVVKYLRSKGARQSRRRRRSVESAMTPTSVSSSAAKHYSAINSVGRYAHQIASALLAPSDLSELTAVGPTNLGSVSGWLMLLNVIGYGCGLGSVRRRFQVASFEPRTFSSPSEIIELSVDPNATIAVHELPKCFERES